MLQHKLIPFIEKCIKLMKSREKGQCETTKSREKKEQEMEKDSMTAELCSTHCCRKDMFEKCLECQESAYLSILRL